MTPQEQQLVADLFDRLASLESQPRDPDAERLIREGLRNAPNAVYVLVQTVLVQDEALKRANARIEELEQAVGGAAQPQGGGGFLDNMRNILGGRDPSRGSVPSVRTGGQGSSGAWGAPNQAQPSAQPGYPPGQPMAPPMGAPMGGGMMPGMGGGSFLGTAAASAAGFIGGSMLLNSIRGMMGGHQAFAGDHAQMGRGGSPWDSGGGGTLGRDAGNSDIGHSHPAYATQADLDQDQDQDQDEGDYDDDGDVGDFDGGDDSDLG
jgi:uncharacterized protein